MTATRKIRIGFDLDGVILYNPARIIRPIVAQLKAKRVIKRKQLQFFQPKTPFQKFFWWLFHQSSFVPADGLADLKELVDSGQVETYLVTARFAHLKPDFERWLARIGADQYFKRCYLNEQNEQPHLFKERMIKKLELDYFVEDNWDIVRYLSEESKIRHQTKVCWIYNMLDRKIEYPFKFAALWQVMKFLKKETKLTSAQQSVLLVSDFFYPHWTGISQSMLNAVQSLKQKLPITVLTIQFKPQLPKQDDIDGITVIREPYWFRFSRTFLSPLLIWRFFKEVGRYDVILLNSPFTHILPISLIAWIFRKKVVLFHQGDLILPPGISNRLLEVLFDFSTLVAGYTAQRVSTYTQDYAEHSRVIRPFLHKFSPVLLPLPVAHRDEVSKPPDKKVVAQLGSLRKKHSVLIGFAGRFVREKGFDVLFKAIPLVVKQYPAAHFVFAGETHLGYENFFGENQAAYELVKKHLTFLGLLKGEELTNFYRSLDFFVLPSRSECFGLVQAEAMLNRKPVVVSNIPGARDVVTKTGYGEIFETENAQDLAEKILSMIKRYKVLDKRYPQVEKYFDYDQSVAQFHSLLAS